MTNVQKITLRISQVRQRLNEIIRARGPEFLTDEVREESTVLQKEFGDLETRHQAAIVAERRNRDAGERCGARCRGP